MKATPSKDGENRFTLKIKVRVGLHEMIDGLGWNLIRNIVNGEDCTNKAMLVEAELKAFRSRRAILDATTKAITADGDAVWTWAEDASTDLCKEIREQSRVLVLKKFPELKVKKES